MIDGELVVLSKDLKKIMGNRAIEQHFELVQKGSMHLCSIALQLVRSNLLRMPFPCTPPPWNSMSSGLGVANRVCIVHVLLKCHLVQWRVRIKSDTHVDE